MGGAGGIMRRGMAVVTVMLVMVVETSPGIVYKVGDSAGWTTTGSIDYKHWASSKTFLLGDIIIFEYIAQFHNVMRVTHSMYKSCNASNPINAYMTGNDTITISTGGHHYFLCGVPGHCQAGQKVDINVIHNSSSSIAPSSSPSLIVPSLSMAAASPSNAWVVSAMGLPLIIFFCLKGKN